MGRFRFDFSELNDENWRYNAVMGLENGQIPEFWEPVPGEDVGKALPGAPGTAAMRWKQGYLA